MDKIGAKTVKKYIFSGTINTLGHRVMAKKGCNVCFERGFLGRDTKTHLYLPCKCIKTIDLPINFIII